MLHSEFGILNSEPSTIPLQQYILANRPLDIGPLRMTPLDSHASQAVADQFHALRQLHARRRQLPANPLRQLGNALLHRAARRIWLTG